MCQVSSGLEAYRHAAGRSPSPSHEFPERRTADTTTKATGGMSNTDHRWGAPFNPYFPAPASLFANRRRELAFYREGLAQGLDARAPGPWKVALLGSWGMAKTRLLRKCASLTDDADHPALCVIVTVKSGMKGLDGLATDLLSRIQAALVSHLDWPEALRREFSRWEPTLRARPRSAVRRSQNPTVTGGSRLFAS